MRNVLDVELCVWCGAWAGLTVDHIPPLRKREDPAEWRGYFVPACTRCQNKHIPERDG